MARYSRGRRESLQRDMSGGQGAMQPHSTLSLTFVVCLIICFVAIPGQCLVAGISLQTDKEVLLRLQRYLLETNEVHRGAYAQWNTSDASPCDWAGIACENGRVTQVNLRESSISSGIFPGFSNLTELSHLDLSRNTIYGTVPATLNQCAKLTYLNLSHNIIDGELNLSGLNQLEVVDVTLNRFTGNIQPDFAEICGNLVTFNISLNRFHGGIRNLLAPCPKIKHLDLSANRFTGDVWLGISRLEEFSVSGNNVTGAITPAAFPSGCRLRVLDLSQNSLWGEFPGSIANCSNLTTLNLWGNRFGGRVPAGIGSFPELESLLLGSNTFDRRIPEQLVDCPKLAFLDLSKNNFGGDVQRIFGRFTQVKSLLLRGNNYTGGIESSGILKLPQLRRLDLSFNNFSGAVPVELARMPKLRILDFAYNDFSGSIPPELGRIATLQGLDFSYNHLSGSIPASIGNLKSLLWLMLPNNSISGHIPPEIGKCRSLLWLNLANNQLSGVIPPSIAGMGRDPSPTFEGNRREGRVTTASDECLPMQRWMVPYYSLSNFVYTIMTRKSCRDAWDNVLTGHSIFPLCKKARNWSPLSRTLTISGALDLTGNRLTGEIPPEIGRMPWLGMVHLSRNGFSGRLPPEVGQLPLLVLNLSSNLFSGPIPPEVGDIKCLQNLDLSNNNFSGEIPPSLNHLTELSRFNVSFNPLLRGRIPSTGQLSTFDEYSFLGDPLIMPGNRNGLPPPPAGPRTPEGDGGNSLTGPVLVGLGTAIAFFPVGFHLGTRLYSKTRSLHAPRTATSRRARSSHAPSTLLRGFAFIYLTLT